MSKNKLYNQSYFVKRVLDAGYFVTRLNVKFEQDDDRKWMVLVNSKKIAYRPNICITCFKNDETKEYVFKFQGQTTRDFTLKTMSMNTIIDILNNVIGEKEAAYIAATTEVDNHEE